MTVVGDDRPVRLLPDLVRVTAANPSVFTGPGTNTYLVGTDDLVVVDPGPDDPHHLDAVATAGAGRIRAIAVTHTHPDHAPGAARLARWTGAPRIGFRSVDGFTADRTAGDFDRVGPPGVDLVAVHTPGHASNHLCYLWARPPGGPGPARVVFTGDHLMDGSTVVIAPPDGDMTAYLAGLRRVAALDPPADVLAPGHGDLISDPRARLEATVAHRLEREAKVADALRAAGTATVDQLVPVVYADVDEARFFIARRSLWAHLRRLGEEGRAVGEDPADEAAPWRWAGG